MTPHPEYPGNEDGYDSPFDDNEPFQWTTFFIILAVMAAVWFITSPIAIVELHFPKDQTPDMP